MKDIAYTLKIVHRHKKDDPHKFYTALQYIYRNGKSELVFDDRLLFLALALPEAQEQAEEIAINLGYQSSLSILRSTEAWEIDIL